jgi:hypothetical protein
MELGRLLAANQALVQQQVEHPHRRSEVCNDIVNVANSVSNLCVCQIPRGPCSKLHVCALEHCTGMLGGMQSVQTAV